MSLCENNLIINPKNKELFSLFFSMDCQLCGKVLVFQLGLCFQCYSKLLKSEEIWSNQNSPTLKLNELKIEVFSILNWSSDHFLNLTPWIVFLKTYQSMWAWRRLSDFIIECELLKKLQVSYSKQELAFIIIPSSTNRKHTHMMGHYLNKKMQISVFDILKFEHESVDYKSLKKTQRSNRKMKINEEITESICEKLNELKCVVFIDDIVTTGNSIKAAKTAIDLFLNHKINYYGLSLFYRAL